MTSRFKPQPYNSYATIVTLFLRAISYKNHRERYGMSNGKGAGAANVAGAGVAKRERFGSRLGFILISAGCAIGLGNVWRFPTSRANTAARRSC